MTNKIARIFLTLCVASMMVACGNSQQELTEAIDKPPASPPGYDETECATPTEEEEERPFVTRTYSVKIAIASDELLNTFSFLHELDYNILLNARGGNASKYPNRDRLVIWSDVLMQDFCVLLIGNDVINDEQFYIPIDSFGYVEELLPGQAFVINSYLDIGMHPWSAITFVDENGNTHYYAIVQNESDEGELYFFEPFEDKTDELPPDWEPWW